MLIVSDDFQIAIDSKTPINRVVKILIEQLPEVKSFRLYCVNHLLLTVENENIIMAFETDIMCNSFYDYIVPRDGVINLIIDG